MIDSDLIKRCQAGEEDAYNSLYKAIYKKTLWTVQLICGTTDKAEDIIQETFYDCFNNIVKLQNIELFQAWFNRILIRKCSKLVKNKFSTVSLDDDDNKIELNDDTNILDVIERNQLNNQVRKAINGLNTIHRTTIVLFYYNELSIKEIAKVMNCFQGTVKSRLYYAKKIISKEFEKDFCTGKAVQINKSEEGKFV